MTLGVIMEILRLSNAPHDVIIKARQLWPNRVFSISDRPDKDGYYSVVLDHEDGPMYVFDPARIGLDNGS